MPLLATGILIALGVLNIKLGFRSVGGICLITAVVVTLASRRASFPRLNRSGLRVVTMVAACVLAGLAVVPTMSTRRHVVCWVFPRSKKYESQKTNLGIVVGGRPEILAATRAIVDSPIVGHGSWAKDPKYVAVLQDELQKAGYRGSPPLSGEAIPAHSHLFGAWVEAGISGAVFWLFALALVSAVMFRLHRLGNGRVVLVAFVSVSMLWDIVFSPFGAERRLIVPFYLVVLLLARKDLSATADRKDAQ